VTKCDGASSLKVPPKKGDMVQHHVVVALAWLEVLARFSVDSSAGTFNSNIFYD
jgi:hypothetical protein